MTCPGRDERLRDGLAAVAEWEAEHGAFTWEELDIARRRVGVSGPEPGQIDLWASQQALGALRNGGRVLRQD
jgi:hypothetical protein